MGHMNPRSLKFIGRKGGYDIDHNGTLAGQAICTLGGIQEDAHPRNTTQKTGGAMELIH